MGSRDQKDCVFIYLLTRALPACSLWSELLRDSGRSNSDRSVCLMYKFLRRALYVLMPRSRVKADYQIGAHSLAMNGAHSSTSDEMKNNQFWPSWRSSNLIAILLGTKEKIF
jgi:hypothetical protein